MSRLVARDGGPDGYDYCQLIRTPDGRLIFPDELEAAVIAQALLAGHIFHRILDQAIPEYTREPRRVKVIVGISHSEGKSTGTNFYAAYSPSVHPEPPVTLDLINQVPGNPVFSPELTGPRSLQTVRKHGASGADYSAVSPDESGQPALTHPARILLGLIACGDELLAAVVPGSAALNEPEIRNKVTELTSHQLQKLSGGFGSTRLAEEYTLINSLVQSLNIAAAALFLSQPDKIPW